MLDKIKISIVIVNYNVRDFLNNCIESIYKSKTNLTYEVIVVDNNSQDNSVPLLSPKFPDVKFIQLNDNLGFSKANNIGFENSSGEFVLILNPDTLLQPDTLQKMYDFLKNDETIGAAGCKVLNGDLTFQLPCRRSFPTPWNSFCKLFGLQKVFPSVKAFSEYNLTYKNIDDTYEVDALIGAFIFARKNVIDEIGGFDESYFMYGEDLDFCFKIKKAGYKIFYFSQTNIIHFKGESTRRSSINEVKHFYEAMQIFVKKHYNSSFFFLLFLKFGIKVREVLSYFIKYRRDFAFFILDIILLIVLFPIANKIRYGYSIGYPEENYNIYLIVLMIFGITSQFLSGNYFERDYSFRKNILSGLMMMLGVGFFIYLIRGFDLSRIVLFITSISFITLNYFYRKYFIANKNSKNLSEYLIVGKNELSQKVSNFFKIKSIEHTVSENKNETYNILKNKKTQLNILLCEDYDIIDFKQQFKSYSENINSITQINNYKDFTFKFSISNSLSSNIIFHNSKLDLLRIKFLKRFVDIFVSLLLLFIGFAFLFLKNGRFAKVFGLLKGDLTLIGIKNGAKLFNYNEGIFSLVELNENISKEEQDELNKYYINNYSLTLDFDIFVKSLFNKKG